MKRKFLALNVIFGGLQSRLNNLKDYEPDLLTGTLIS